MEGGVGEVGEVGEVLPTLSQKTDFKGSSN